MAKRINAPPLFGGFARCALNPVRTIDGPLRQRRYCARRLRSVPEQDVILPSATRTLFHPAIVFPRDIFPLRGLS